MSCGRRPEPFLGWSFQGRSGRPVEAGPGWRVLTFFLEMRQHRLAVHAVLDDFRLLLPDLENLSASINAAQIFHVWQQESKVIEQGAYRKSGE